MTSSIALLIGRVDAPFTSSAPSAMTHVALSCRPHSFNRVERSTPVHSALLHVPCDCCTFLCVALALFAIHSTKWNLVTDGKRFNSAMVKIRGRSTKPLIKRVCLSGSMSGTKAPLVVAQYG